MEIVALLPQKSTQARIDVIIVKSLRPEDLKRVNLTEHIIRS